MGLASHRGSSYTYHTYVIRLGLVDLLAGSIGGYRQLPEKLCVRFGVEA